MLVAEKGNATATATWHLYNVPSSKWMSLDTRQKPDYLQRVAALSRKRGKR